MAQRETWATRLGFILAAVGSAVGLGNIWRFPWIAAENGGAAFLVVYLIAALGIGFPAMLMEFSIGRRAKRNVIDAFDRVGHRNWRFVGLIGLLTGFWILSYYSVVGGWVIQYVIGSASGAYFGAPGEYFGVISAGTDALLFHALFMALTVGIVAFGVEEGIELATKVMVPAIVVLLLALGAWAFTLDGAAAGYAYFLSPDFEALTANLGTIIPFAVGQAFFSLSLGMGAMITYSSYIGRDENLGEDALSIVLLNTFIGVLAGLVVFPLLFAQGVSPGEPGPGAIFVSIATAFEALPGGRILGVLFFGVVAIAALSSAISLLEVVVSYVIDNYDVERRVTALGIGLVIFLLGIPTALDTATLGTYDQFANSVMLPVSVFFIVVFVGWVLARDAVDEVLQGTRGNESLGTTWLWHVRVVVLLAVVLTVVLGIADFTGVELL